MEKKTAQYKRTLRGSVGAGIGALLNGDGRRYYILEHKDASKYHKVGESQKIIIDQIELGRDENCQVRFDEGFPTVSRRHAAIVKNGEGWKLIHLSTTNSTFLNGQSVSTEHPLQNGDEIQLSVGGPRLGFLVPAGKQSLVSSIKITERLELFRKQALKPYKTAIACMFALLVVVSGVGAYVWHEQHQTIISQGETIESQGKTITAQGETIRNLLASNDVRDKELADAKDRNKKIQNELARIRKTVASQSENPEKNLISEIERIKPSVYYVETEVYYEIEGEVNRVALSSGTGFLTDDGRFVTARHCVEPWLFNQELNVYYAISLASEGLRKIYAVINAYNSQGDSFQFKDMQFNVDPTYDSPCSHHVKLGDYEFDVASKVAFGTEVSLGNDWAYCKVNKQGTIKAASELSKSLKSGTSVHMLGFPKRLGIGDGKTMVDPIYNKLNVSRDGLTKARCIMVNQGVEHGNSGGPVLTLVDGKLQVIGIVSRGDHNSDFYNHLIPMCNLD